jgi:outer membrane lipoprotein carrier protein
MKSDNKSRILLFTFYFLLSTSLIAGEDESRLEGFLDGLESYSAAFEQIQFNESGEQLEKAIGVVYMRRPGMIHWSYWEPYTQLIISDGVSLWIYEEDLEQVIIKDVSDSIEDSPAAILAGDVVINDHYVVISQGVHDGKAWMELTPRDIESQYAAIKLGFVENQLTDMELYDSMDNKTVIRFLDTKRNTKLNLELFQFTPPEGVDVIDSRP